MIILATSVMTILHPGWAFGANWVNAGWTWKKTRRADVETAPESDSPPSTLLKE